jgi:hypothetical protein
MHHLVLTNMNHLMSGERKAKVQSSTDLFLVFVSGFPNGFTF